MTISIARFNRTCATPALAKSDVDGLDERSFELKAKENRSEEKQTLFYLSRTSTSFVRRSSTLDHLHRRCREDGTVVSWSSLKLAEVPVVRPVDEDENCIEFDWLLRRDQQLNFDCATNNCSCCFVDVSGRLVDRSASNRCSSRTRSRSMERLNRRSRCLLLSANVFVSARRSNVAPASCDCLRLRPESENERKKGERRTPVVFVVISSSSVRLICSSCIDSSVQSIANQ